MFVSPSIHDEFGFQVIDSGDQSLLVSYGLMKGGPECAVQERQENNVVVARARIFSGNSWQVGS